MRLNDPADASPPAPNPAVCPMIATVIALCALSVSAAVLVIKDLDEPYGGLFGIPARRCATR